MIAGVTAENNAQVETMIKEDSRLTQKRH